MDCFKCGQFEVKPLLKMKIDNYIVPSLIGLAVYI